MSDDAPVRQGLPRSMRMRQAREFQAVREQGRRATNGCMIMNWKTLSEGSTSKLGVITSRKLGNAVVRTRARRLLRETFRLHQNDFKTPVSMVLIARNSIAGKFLSDVEKDFLFLANRANLIR